MNKNAKENIKLLLLILLVLAIPLVFISLEAIHKIRSLSNSDENSLPQNPLDMLYENITSAPKHNDASSIRTYLNEIFNLMNKKDFTSLYALLTDDIKEYMFQSEELFSNYMKNYLEGKLYSPTFLEYEKINNQEKNIFIVNVNFLPYSTSEEDVINNNSTAYKTDTFTIYENKDNTFTFSFNKYIGANKSETNVFENELFSCKLLATHLYTTHTTFDIEITNKTNEAMFIDKKEIYTLTGTMTKYYTPYTSIPANSKTKISFTIYTGLNLKDSLPEHIYFRGIHHNDNVHFFAIPVKYPIKITSW